MIALWCLCALFLVWLGYPLIIASLAGQEVPSSAVSSAVPTVSVVIASRDDVDAIRARVENCLATNYPADSIEVVVGLDASIPRGPCDDATPLARAKIVAGDPPGGKAATLNAAIRASCGDI